ncbi:MAG: DUF4381 domain-containing protein [Pseudomonadota bacterium]
MDNNTLLQQLHDIHQPPAISWWPLAWGWYLCLVPIILLAILFAFWLRHRLKKGRLRQEALNKLQQLKQHYQQSKSSASIAQLNKLLKQIALHRWPNEPIATRYDQQWLLFLDRSGKTKAFSEGLGQALITAAYQAESTEDYSALFDLAAQWIRRQF